MFWTSMPLVYAACAGHWTRCTHCSDELLFDSDENDELWLEWIPSSRWRRLIRGSVTVSLHRLKTLKRMVLVVNVVYISSDERA